MRPVPAPLLVALALWAAPVFAQDGSDKDALFGSAAPAPVAWRVPMLKTPGTRPPLIQSFPSAELIKSLRSQIKIARDDKFRKDLLDVLDTLENGAAKASSTERQGWIDSHLGELNAIVRSLPPDAPKETVHVSARAAARLNARAERWEESREFSQLALLQSPDDPEALLARSLAGSRLGDFTLAYADADRVARSSPGTSEAYTARAAAAYGLGNYLQAVEDARRALALDADDKTAFSLMKLSEGRMRTSPEFEKNQPQLADAVEREYHGMIQQLNQFEEQRRFPPERIGPSALARLTASAASRLAVKDYWGALEDADKAVALDSTDPRALYIRAVAHNLLGEYGEAVYDATRGLTVSPSEASLRDARAWAYNRMGRAHDAIADSQHAIEVDPRDAYAFANRAYANELRGDFTAMAEDYKTASEINPQFEPAYRDAARRHGLTPEPLDLNKRRSPSMLDRAVPPRARSFAAVLIASLVGGLLISLGVLHVVDGIKEQRASSRIPATSLEASYEIGKAIGQGGMGVVYEAVDRKLRRPVAVKMLRDEFKLDDDAKARFIEEARTVAELSHPAIVDIHSIVEDERGVSLVFERLDGTTLDQILAQKGRLKLREAKRILQSVCGGLAYAHAHDVIHRDLKPANVMILKDGGVKLLDFGISRHAAKASAAAVTQSVTGTPHYMAPEQEYGCVRKENDVFSLGAVLYEMLTGHRPFEGSPQAKLAKAYHRASQFVPTIPLELDALIDRALEPDPEKRIHSPAEFWRELDSIEDA